MKKLILLALVALSSLAAEAQTKEYGKHDYEVMLSIPAAANKVDGYTHSGYSPYIGFEYRRQLNKLPMDVGLHMAISAVVRIEDDYYSEISYFRAVPILAVSDYQFGRGKKINPYAGLGMGISMNAITHHIGKNDISYTVAPRVGVRLYKFLNISACYYAMHKDYARLNFNVGVYF